MDNILMWVGLVLMGVATVGGWVPLWKSARLSPDSIRRRVYWTGTALAALTLFMATLPDLKTALIVGIGTGLGMSAIAVRWTGHLKINGRVITGNMACRRPDRPPTLTRES